jgi:hypothetical protein
LPAQLHDSVIAYGWVQASLEAANVDLANFLFLCRCLSVDNSAAAVSALRKEICTGDVDWRQIAQVAADHFLTPALWVSLSRKGLSTDLPDDAREFLQYVHSLNVARNKAIRAGVLQIASSLNEAGVEPILLKGAINLFDNPYGDVGARMMRDVDILIPELEIAPILTALAKLGYSPEVEARWHTHTYSFLGRPGETWGLDLHRYLGYQNDIVPPVDVRREAVALETDGLRLLAPSPRHRMFHNMFHAQLQNQCQALGLIPLMQLHEFAVLGQHYSELVDWRWLALTVRRRKIRRALRAYVHLAVELLGFVRPPEIPGGLGAKLHHRRCLAQLRSPAVLSLARQWGSVTDVLKPLYIANRYGCATNPLVINFFRLRRVYEALRKHRWKIIGKIHERRQFDPGHYR